jgi:hypothetical protein
MIYLIAGLLITFACYVLFLVSDKQRPKTQKSRWAKCAEHYQICRYLAFGVLAATLILLIQFTVAVWECQFICICNPDTFYTDSEHQRLKTKKIKSK